MDQKKRRPTSADSICDLQVVHDRRGLGHVQFWFLGMRILRREQEDGNEDKWDSGGCDAMSLTHRSHR
jgi:hypothetical protein